MSLHGVGLGLGTFDPIDSGHLNRLVNLMSRVEPRLVSNHLCWNARDGRYFNDLLPLSYTEEAPRHVAEPTVRVQEVRGRRTPVENVPSYLEFGYAGMSEWALPGGLGERVDGGILLDVNNICINACTHSPEDLECAAAVGPDRVEQIHLAVHTRREFQDGSVLPVDTHDPPVCAETWKLHLEAVRRLRFRSTPIEWDVHLPPPWTLEGEAGTADRILEGCHVRVG